MNKIDSRIYIGSSIRVRRRIMEHMAQLRRGKHTNGKLQNFVNKYGIENLYANQISCYDPTKLLELEQHYIDFLNPEFNIAKVAGSPMAGMKHSLESRQKMSLSGKGRKLPPRTKEHTERVLMARAGFKHTEETKKHVSSTMAGGKGPSARLVLNGQNGVFFDCAIDAAESIGMNVSTLRNKLNGQKPNNTRFLYV